MPKKSNFRIVIIIPARYQSSRLPGKPLIDICGQSMISRTYDRCCLALESKDVFVATDDDRIYNHCQENNINVLMTPGACKTGTDRVYEASKQVRADIYINVQGDEPIIDPDNIKRVIRASTKNSDQVIATMSIIDEEEYRNNTIPKVVTSIDNKLLYASRASIPTTKTLDFIYSKKQIGIYAFPRKSLENFVAVKNKTPLEALEDIEILRFLELGYEVQMLELVNNSFAVDVPDDIKKVEKVINAQFN
jgi:3-deoxy-manno-octulosonate cytidylyltransferase (CMP-KDO synthetase)